MPRIQRTPYNPAKPVHDRRTADPTRLAELAPIEVADPYALEPGDKIVVMRSIRDDPLGSLHAHRHIDEAQYQAGRKFQDDFETAGRGPQAIDPTKEHVDGGMPPEPLGKAQQKALDSLNRAHVALGHEGAILAKRVLIDGLTCKQIAVLSGIKGRRGEEYIGMRFKGCLNDLAQVYGFAMQARA